MNWFAKTTRLPHLLVYPALLDKKKSRVLLVSVMITTTCAASGAVLLRYAPLPSGAVIDPSRVFAADRQVMGDLIDSGITRQEVMLSQVPIYLQEATIAVEDASFYSHYGLNAKGIIRAFLANIGAGHIVQGGSTITQQLAKNLFLNGNRTMWRKVQEAVYALQLELHYSKQKILTDYLNVIYYGDGATGVGTAAEYYFGKPVNRLNLAESAMLAGLPKGPSIYSPLRHLQSAKDRQRVVLQAMVKAGYISQNTAHAAFVQPLHFSHHAAPDSIAPYFMDALTRVAQKQFHLSKDDLYRGGLNIHSTLDINLQRALDRAISKYIPKGSGLQIAAIAMNPQTGDVLAYSGGTNYRTSPFDRVNAMRQPGSTFKPFVYAAALDKGWTASTHFKSQPTIFTYGSNGVYAVHNFADDYSYGPIDMKQAIERSDNVFAVKANMSIGPEQVIQTAERFGLSSDMSPYPSLALGVFPVSALQLARAYSVFANGGYLVKPQFVTDVQDSVGHVLYRSNPSKLLVETPATCYILTDMMKSVMQPGGTGYRVAHLIPGTIAAKTGTTDTDAWMVGYTPETVCAVWVGFDKMRPIDSVDSHLAAPILASVMREAFMEKPQGEFKKPSTVVSAMIDPETGELATSICPQRQLNYFVVGTEPKRGCYEHPEKNLSLGDRALNVLRSVWSWIHGQ